MIEFISVSHDGFKSKIELKKFYFELSHYNRYGLLKDDLVDDHHCSIGAEAVRRLPEQMFDERNFRHIRACQLSIEKDYLPKEQWVQYEEDLAKGSYLQPYLREVKAEIEEKNRWEKEHNK